MRRQLFVMRTIGAIGAALVGFVLVVGLLKDTRRTDTFGSTARHIVVDKDTGSVANWIPIKPSTHS